MTRKKDKPQTSRKTTRRAEAPLVVERGVTPEVTVTETEMMLSPEQRSHMIAECAYYIAAERGFAPGSELDDWLAAEVTIDRQLGNN